ncbi:TetR/AcrR family transcriptional regulator [Gordonia humi]|uniref:AcrR family transcriptional regulator n=1 Tax=Gordonia humi TaxID=686429 RepID=A0A840EZX7_9ACTN|nr:TetR/AcrR family transcriptional regulator [Gordonia humi]MBB4135858.1 AcrR family transcriptional regulator [Gordonia humi]
MIDSTRDRLVAAGVEIVDATGFRDVGVRAVAARTGVSHGAPRRYFPTLDSLLAAIAAEGVADLDAVLTPAMTQGIGETASAYWRFARERPGMFELIFRHDLLDGAGGGLRATTGRWFASLTDVFGDAERALACWAAVHGLCVLAATWAVDAVGVTVDESVVRRTAESFG